MPEEPSRSQRLAIGEGGRECWRGQGPPCDGPAAYGDGGPWYIPLTRSFDEGGYEPSVANVSPRTEPAYRQAIRDLLTEDRPGVGRPAL